MPDAKTRELQRALNRFTSKYLRKVTPLIVDGDKGHATNSRIKLAKFYLGYGDNRDAKVTRAFVNRLLHPRSPNYSPGPMRRRASRRRVAQRARARQQSARATVAPGVGRFDGVPCATWLIPHLAWARKSGWQGKLVSGWRSPAYSESLCKRMCGRPSCPGRCAGRASNHSGSRQPKGAVDVSDYARFERIIARSPHKPSICNRLDSRDPVHFSNSGR